MTTESVNQMIEKKLNDNLYIDIHVIQNLPPACVNRDDTGSPKTAVYGGTTRARVSSQAWKRAIRQQFNSMFPDDLNGMRTRHIGQIMTECLIKERPELEEKKAETIAKKALKYAGVPDNVLFLISPKQIKELVKVTVENIDNGKFDKSEKKKNGKDREPSKKEKKVYEDAVKNNPSIDMLLFGRMAAQNKNLNYDATCQVAHAISTHEIHNEYDYFTAIDDYNSNSEDDSGAGHLGTVEYNSSTLYRYANINIAELQSKLYDDDLLITVIDNFIQAFVSSMPTGKQNTFANRTLPSLVYITLRNDQPINLVEAYEKAIKTSSAGYVDQSIKALANFAHNIYSMYDAYPEHSWYINLDDVDFDNSEREPNIKKLIDDTTDAIKKEICKS